MAGVPGGRAKGCGGPPLFWRGKSQGVGFFQSPVAAKLQVVLAVLCAVRGCDIPPPWPIVVFLFMVLLLMVIPLVLKMPPPSLLALLPVTMLLLIASMPWL